MAGSVIARHLNAVALACLLPLALCCAPLAQAGDDLPDPTRPGLATGPGEIPVAASGEDLRLESVILGHGTARQFAIISGQRYQVGQMVGNAKLMKLQADAVVLQEGGKMRSLQMYPDIVKKRVQTEVAPAGAKKRGKMTQKNVTPSTVTQNRAAVQDTVD